MFVNLVRPSNNVVFKTKDDRKNFLASPNRDLDRLVFVSE